MWRKAHNIRVDIKRILKNSLALYIFWSRKLEKKKRKETHTVQLLRDQLYIVKANADVICTRNSMCRGHPCRRRMRHGCKCSCPQFRSSSRHEILIAGLHASCFFSTRDDCVWRSQWSAVTLMTTAATPTARAAGESRTIELKPEVRKAGRETQKEVLVRLRRGWRTAYNRARARYSYSQKQEAMLSRVLFVIV